MVIPEHCNMVIECVRYQSSNGQTRSFARTVAHTYEKLKLTWRDCVVSCSISPGLPCLPFPKASFARRWARGSCYGTFQSCWGLWFLEAAVQAWLAT